MTNDRVRANDETRPVEPVTKGENKEVFHHALCAEDLFVKHVDQVKALRARQAAYLDSLPSDPTEVIRAARDILEPNYDEYPDGEEEAMHLSCALAALVQSGQLDGSGNFHEAALYVSDRVHLALHRVTRQLDRVNDILGNAGRIERGR